MIKTDEIISKIEKYASLDLMEPWDNSGWQINLHHDYVNRVLIALSLTKETLSEAITNDCDLIITHHPLIFDKLSKIDSSIIVEAIKHNICVYSAHTNLDKTYGSTTDALAGVLGFKNLVTVDEYIKIAHLKDEIDLMELLSGIKTAIGTHEYVSPDNYGCAIHKIGVVVYKAAVAQRNVGAVIDHDRCQHLHPDSQRPKKLT